MASLTKEKLFAAILCKFQVLHTKTDIHNFCFFVDKTVFIGFTPKDVDNSLSQTRRLQNYFAAIVIKCKNKFECYLMLPMKFIDVAVFHSVWLQKLRRTGILKIKFLTLKVPFGENCHILWNKFTSFNNNMGAQSSWSYLVFISTWTVLRLSKLMLHHETLWYAEKINLRLAGIFCVTNTQTRISNTHFLSVINHLERGFELFMSANNLAFSPIRQPNQAGRWTTSPAAIWL
jgi:hypothetical protein